MRSKIVFLVVFMLSFVIVHDTVLTVIDQNKKIDTVASVDSGMALEQSTDIHQIHNLCHFVALVCREISPASVPCKHQTVAYYVPEHILPYNKSLIKPPIA